jgi:hypothetical protein
MCLQWGSPLVWSIYMRDGTRGGLMPYMAPCETLATTLSRLNSEALATRVVLAHPHAAFHPYKCGLCRGTTMVAAALIDYDDIKVAAKTTTRRRRSWSTTSSTSMCDFVGSLLQLFFHYAATRPRSCVAVFQWKLRHFEWLRFGLIWSFKWDFHGDFVDAVYEILCGA